MSYKTYIEDMQNRWWNQYWNTGIWMITHLIMHVLCQIEDPEDYEVTYKIGHKWSERELMKLRFNLEEIKLEPRYWEKTQEVRNMVFPQEVKETKEIYRKAKQDWEQKYATGVQWQIIAEQAIQQQIDRLRLDKELQKRKAESKIKGPLWWHHQKWAKKNAHLGRVTRRLLLKKK